MKTPFLPMLLLAGAFFGGFNHAQAQVLFYVSAGVGSVETVSSTGTVETYASFLSSSDLAEGLAFGEDGTLYLADGGDPFLWKIPPNGEMTLWTSSGQSEGGSFGLVLGSNGNFFAAIDGFRDGLIAEITPGGMVTTFASLPNPTLAEPFGFAFGSGGNLFVTDASQNKIYGITPGGVLSTYLSISSATALTGLAFDSSGNLFVADFGGSIYKVTPGGTVSTYATLGANSGLKGLAFDSSNDLFVAEQNQNEIAEITPQGTVENFATIQAPQFLVAAAVPEPSCFILSGAGLIFVILGRHLRLRRATL